MTKGERITYWQKVVKEQAQSSLSVTDFCQDHQINSQRFYLWHQRFNSQSPALGRGNFRNWFRPPRTAGAAFVFGLIQNSLLRWIAVPIPSPFARLYR